MNKFWTIFKREYLTRVKTKGFIIGTALTPLFIILISIGPGLLMNLKSEKVKHVSVVDLSGLVYEKLVASLSDTTGDGRRLYEFTQVQASEENLPAVKSELSQSVDLNQIDGYFIIPADIIENNISEFYAKSVSNFDENRTFQNAITGIITEYRLKQSNLDPKIIHDLTKRVNLKTFKVAKGGEEKEDVGLSFAVTFIMVMFLYMALIMYGAFVMRSVYEEKLSRVVEVIISSCKPFQLMAGKVMGIGAVGLTQYLIWAAFAGLLTFYSGSIIKALVPSASEVPMPTIPISVLVYFVIYFILGYLLFATLYAALGAMVDSDQDAQQLQFPVIMIIMLAFFSAFYIIKNPSANLSVILSYIPFFSPITMFTRISVLTPPFIEILISIIILVLTILFLIWLAGKIFRVGILMYGKRPTLPEVLTWIRYK
ncbi:MAG: ABC transporter permease [Candidatus Zhuqueibacterota bacterium]